MAINWSGTWLNGYPFAWKVSANNCSPRILLYSLCALPQSIYTKNLLCDKFTCKVSGWSRLDTLPCFIASSDRVKSCQVSSEKHSILSLKLVEIKLFMRHCVLLRRGSQSPWRTPPCDILTPDVPRCVQCNTPRQNLNVGVTTSSLVVRQKKEVVAFGVNAAFGWMVATHSLLPRILVIKTNPGPLRLATI